MLIEWICLWSLIESALMLMLSGILACTFANFHLFMNYARFVIQLCMAQETVTFFTAPRFVVGVDAFFDAFASRHRRHRRQRAQNAIAPIDLADRHFKCNVYMYKFVFLFRLPLLLLAPCVQCAHNGFAIETLAMYTRSCLTRSRRSLISFFLSYHPRHIHCGTRSHCPKSAQIDSNRVDCSLFVCCARTYNLPTIHIYIFECFGMAVAAATAAQSTTSEHHNAIHNIQYALWSQRTYSIHAPMIYGT